MSSRRHRDHSRRSSSQHGDLNLAVTQSFEGLNLGETANAYSASEYPTYPSSFNPPIPEEAPYLSDLTSMSHYYEMPSPHQGYSGVPTHSKHMSFSYFQLPLNGQGFAYPNTEVPLSRSMSDHSSHMLPVNILPSSFEDFADVDRDISRQRRRRQTRVRREHKTRTRRRAAMLSPGEGDDHGSSLAGELSGSIDNLTAHHPGVHGGPGYSYTSPDPSRPTYGTTSAPYDYPGSMYTTTASYPQTFSTTAPSDPFRSDRRGPSHDNSLHVPEQRKPQCWDHGCNGRTFSTFSNLLRHQREKSGTSTKSTCPRCGAEFTRKTARDGHMAHDKCKGGRK